MNKEEALRKIEELREYVENYDKTIGIRKWLNSMSLEEEIYEVIDESHAVLNEGWFVYSWVPVPHPYTRFQARGRKDGKLEITLLGPERLY